MALTALPGSLDGPAWLHGHSVFTTVRLHAGGPLLLPAHLARLAHDAAALGLPAPPGGLAWGVAGLELPESGLLRLTLTGWDCFYSLRPLSPLPPAARLLPGDWAVHPQLQFHKSGNHAPYRLALAQAEAVGADEALLRGPGGDFVDGGRSSPLARVEGEYLVPDGGLPGVTRAAALTALGVTPRVAPFTLELLKNADALWLCGSGVGVWPVRGVLGLRSFAPQSWPLPAPWATVPTR